MPCPDRSNAIKSVKTLNHIRTVTIGGGGGKKFGEEMEKKGEEERRRGVVLVKGVEWEW